LGSTTLINPSSSCRSPRRRLSTRAAPGRRDAPVGDGMAALRAYLQVDPVDPIETTSMGLDSPVEPCPHRAPGLLRAEQPCRKLPTPALHAGTAGKPGTSSRRSDHGLGGMDNTSGYKIRAPALQFFAGHPAAEAAGSSRFAFAVGSCATDEDGSCIPPASQVRCRSMTSLNSEFHAPFRHRPGNFPDASQKRYLQYQPSKVHVGTTPSMMSRYRERSEDCLANLANHPLRVVGRLVTLFLIASDLVK
jgi:hypothetical protein